MELVFFTAQILLMHFRVFQQQPLILQGHLFIFLKASIVECLHLPWSRFFPSVKRAPGTCCKSFGCELIGFFVVKKHQCVFHNWGASWAYRTFVRQRWESVNCTRNKETCIPWPRSEIICEHCHMVKGPRSKEPNSTPSSISTMPWILVKSLHMVVKHLIPQKYFEKHIWG